MDAASAAATGGDDSGHRQRGTDPAENGPCGQPTGARGLERIRAAAAGPTADPQLPWRNATAAVLKKLRNPFWIQAQPEGLQSTGWLGGWTAVASTRAIAAESAADLAAGVRFARQHRLRLVVKGAGHDYLGRNCAPDSLLLWTQPMQGITVQEAFVPQGAPAGTAPVQAITVQAGVRWLDVYAAATAAGRYVQGGCTSVGACGGFILGSGFGSSRSAMAVAPPVT